MGGHSPQLVKAPSFPLILCDDLDAVKYRLVSKMKWSHERVNAAIPEYIRFLFLLANAEKGTSMAPSIEVDEVWHAHILHTALYANHCQQIAGRFIHHSPSAPSESKETGRSAYRTTLLKYAETFKHDPPGNVWPSLCEAECGEECTNVRCRSQCPSCNAQCEDDGLTME